MNALTPQTASAKPDTKIPLPTIAEGIFEFKKISGIELCYTPNPDDQADILAVCLVTKPIEERAVVTVYSVPDVSISSQLHSYCRRFKYTIGSDSPDHEAKLHRTEDPLNSHRHYVFQNGGSFNEDIHIFTKSLLLTPTLIKSNNREHFKQFTQAVSTYTENPHIRLKEFLDGSTAHYGLCKKLPETAEDILGTRK